jgi:hypothetical protein
MSLNLPEDEARELRALIGLCDSSLVDAALALRMYQAARPTATSVMDREAFEAKRAKRRDFEDEVRRDWGLKPHDYSKYQEVSVECDLRLIRKNLEDGVLPSTFEHRISFVHAKSFLFSIDMIRKAISRMMSCASAVAAAQEALDLIDRELPDLSHVRNSAAHVEDRVLGMKNNNKPIPHGGALFIGNLEGDVYSGTIADGRNAGVAVTDHSIVAAHSAVQGLIDKLAWNGFPRLSAIP